MRKVIEEATRTLCWSWVSPSKPVMLAGGPFSGTRRVTTAPTIRLRTGKDPAWGWVWRSGKTTLWSHITSNLISFGQNDNIHNFSKLFKWYIYDRKPILLLGDSWGQFVHKNREKLCAVSVMPSFIDWVEFLSLLINMIYPVGFVKLSQEKKMKIFYSDSLQDIPTDMCLEVPRKKYVNMGKKAV